jgi:hypothetical protein
VGDLFKAYKNNANISIFDIYTNKSTPKRPASVEVSRPASEPVHLRRALASSASSDSNESNANGAAEGYMPHSQRFKAIKMKFETMIQKNTKTHWFVLPHPIALSFQNPYSTRPLLDFE